jgi:hypothetical protein
VAGGARFGDRIGEPLFRVGAGEHRLAQSGKWLSLALIAAGRLVVLEPTSELSRMVQELLQVARHRSPQKTAPSGHCVDDHCPGVADDDRDFEKLSVLVRHAVFAGAVGDQRLNACHNKLSWRDMACKFPCGGLTARDPGDVQMVEHPVLGVLRQAARRHLVWRSPEPPSVNVDF